jgi:hypothetical protein
MLELKTKKELATEAFKLAHGSSLVRYRSVTYIPADYETRATDIPPDVDRTIWIPLNRHKVRLLASSQFDTLFSSDGELASFDFMVAQNALQMEEAAEYLLVRTPDGLRQLTPDGELQPPSGEFVPNALVPMLNTEEKDKTFVFSVIENWLDSAEDAESLLYHLATCLSPGYSAVKYVLLIGEGRNGKSLLLKMLQSLFGFDNVSTVTRQQIAEQSPVVCELNGKLLNLVFDGRAEYLKDSGTEKSLIAGEPVPIRRLYESTPTQVQSNALFVEGLNKEPKSNDKSSALQKRLVRFQFPNVYALDHKFEKRMLREKYLGAFLALLIDRYVKEDEVAEKLAPTQRAIELQLEHMYVNSMGLQFLKHLEEHDALGVIGLLGSSMTELAEKFRSWRLKENDLGVWAEPDIVALFMPLLNTERKTVRTAEGPRKIRVATSLKSEADAYIKSLKGDDDAELINALVED